MPLLPYPSDSAILVFSSGLGLPWYGYGYPAQQSLLTYDSPDSIQSLPWFSGGNDRGNFAYDAPYLSPVYLQSRPWYNVAADNELLTFGSTPTTFAYPEVLEFFTYSDVYMGPYGTGYSAPEISFDTSADFQVLLIIQGPGECEEVEVLREGFDYEVDLVNGRIMFLSTGQLGPGASNPNVCGVVVRACCAESGCLYADFFACDLACYVHEGYDTVIQEGAEKYKSDDEKMIKRAIVEAEPLPASTPASLECDVGYGSQSSCMTWRPLRPLDFECQTERTPSEHAALRSRQDGVFSYPTWARGVYISTRFRISGIGGGGVFSGLHKIIKGWGQPESP